MYKVTLDGYILYKPDNPSAMLTDPVLELEPGYAGIFTATVPPENPLYDRVSCRKSMLSVYRDDREIFYGEVRKIPKVDRNKNKEIYCTSALSFLADSIQPQAEYHNMTPFLMLKAMLDVHNAQVEDRKKIFIGQVTVSDPNDSLYRYTNYENTLAAIRDKLVNRLGGCLRLRHENDMLYLDWITIQEYGVYNQQPIEFGLNLLDYSETLSAEDVVTALIPLGAVLEGESEIEALEKRVDITSVNSNKNYVSNLDAIEQFGWVWATNTWDDVTQPSNLKRKAEEWLTTTQYETMTLNLTAADLSELGHTYDAFNEGDRVHCLAKPYGMDIVLPVMKLTIPLQNPAGRTLELSTERQKTYTETQSSFRTQMTEQVSEQRSYTNQNIQASVDNLTAIMTGVEGGYKLTEYNADGYWLRDLYMDAPNVEDAVNILQINREGIAGSTNGYSGPYTVGMTIQGLIVGSRIAAHTIDAEKLSLGLNAWIAGVDDGIESRVEKDGVISAINQSSEAVTINAGKINLNGYVTLTNLSDGTTVISGDNIKTGTIAAERIAAGAISADKLSVGVNATLEALEDGLESRVEKNGIISAINQSSEAVSIKAQKINLNGAITANNYFKIKNDGSMEAIAGKISGFTLKEDRLMFGDYTNASNWLSMCTPHGGAGDVYLGQGGISTDSYDGSSSGIVKSIKLSEGRITFHKGVYLNGAIGMPDGGLIALMLYDSQDNCVMEIDRNSVVFPGDLYVEGTKSRMVGTESYGSRLLYSYEMPAPMFGDAGEGVISDDGLCVVDIDPVFAETIADGQYQVFLQNYGSGLCHVKTRSASFFVVEGTPGLSFGWEMKAKQKDFRYEHLESVDSMPDIPSVEDYEKQYAAEIAGLISDEEELLYGND